MRWITDGKLNSPQNFSYNFIWRRKKKWKYSLVPSYFTSKLYFPRTYKILSKFALDTGKLITTLLPIVVFRKTKSLHKSLKRGIICRWMYLLFSNEKNLSFKASSKTIFALAICLTPIYIYKLHTKNFTSLNNLLIFCVYMLT